MCLLFFDDYFTSGIPSVCLVEADVVAVRVNTYFLVCLTSALSVVLPAVSFLQPVFHVRPEQRPTITPNKRRQPNDRLMLGQRRRRWPNIKMSLV